MLAAASALAQTPVALPEIDVVADRADRPPTLSSDSVAPAAQATIAATTPDASRLFTPVPGVAFQKGGGVSSLPVVRGLADDRNKVLLGGLDIASACANHMNPPLSYAAPGSVGTVEAITGAVPVSRGGDSIGGVVVVKPRAPIFARSQAPAPQPGPRVTKGEPAPQPAGDVVFAGSLSTFYRSANDGVSVSGAATVATRNFSLSYAGAWAKGGNYRAGGGQTVRSTEFRSENHLATLAYENDGHTLTLRGGLQRIPYQGFVNQRMDMLGNDGLTLDLGYAGRFGWGTVEANAYWHRTRHYMNFLADKGGSTSSTGMPMYTDGRDIGANVKADINLSARDVLRVGANAHLQRLDDWWPPVAGMFPGMCCNTFWNINDGRRDRIGAFAEWDAKWSPAWSTQLGARVEAVHMNAGPVQGYSNVDSATNMMGRLAVTNYLSDSTAFNAANRARTDVNVDLTALLRYEPSKASAFELGLTRKVRSPNLYERYAWSKGSPTFGMSPNMVNWFGDANGYVGNLNLKPEAAHTITATMVLRDPTDDRWELKVSPYASYVENYIDADRLWRQTSMMGMPTPFYTLQFANHDARLFGVDVSGRARLADHADYGRLSLAGSLSYVRGKNLDTGDNLYNIMPLQVRASLEHRIRLGGGDLTTSFEVEAVQSKTLVNATRGELTKPAYALVNLRAAYEWRNLRLDAGVENLLDKAYYLPLGGVNFTAFRAGVPLRPVAGVGRSFYAGLTAKF
ncbi:MAG: TonB-dependent receptor [Rhizobiales bacterium]|nr:TonB-dependent receptor [Hyphomicrobiales bacterium]